MDTLSLWTPLLDVVGDAICLLDANHTVLNCNTATEILVGKRSDEICGQKCWAIFHNLNGVHPDCPFERIMKTLERESSEMQIDDKWYEVLLDPIVDDNGKLVSILHTLRSIDDRKRAELEMAKSAERFRLMIDNAPYGAHIYELTGDGQLIFVGANSSADKILGVDNSQFVGKTIEQAFPDLVSTDVPEAYRMVATTGQPYSTESISYSDDKGIAGAFEVCAFQTSPNHMTALFRDITEKKRHEEELKKSHFDTYIERERLAVTLRSIGDGVITTDAQGNVVFLNTVAEQMTGWSSAEAIGKPLTDVFYIVNEYTRMPCENPVEKVLKTGLIVELANHTMLISRDNREIILADSGAPIVDATGNIYGVVLVFRDITEKQKILEAMHKAQKLDSLGILAGGIAHDFNNLLGGIFGYIDLALLDSKLPVKVREYLGDSMKVLSRAKNLTQQLLTFSKGGTPILKVGALDRAVRDAALFALSGSSVSCRFNFKENLWSCEYDENQLAQAIENVVINAQQSMPSGGVIDLYIENVVIGPETNGLISPGRYLKIAVRDYGIGMPKELIAKIFDPFFTTKQRGHGLGLSTVYSIVHKHDGFVDVDSEPGKGTTFFIYLPASKRSAEVECPLAGELLQGSGRILVMDDEEFIRNTLSTMLARLGYQAFCVNDGAAVLAEIDAAAAREEKYDLIILDLTVAGGMGGKEAIVQIRAQDSAIPVIVASGYSDDPVLANPLHYGFSMSIAKPFTLRDLGAALNGLLKNGLPAKKPQ